MKETCLLHFHWSVIFLLNFTNFYINKIVTDSCMFYRECRAIRLSKIILACPDFSVYDPRQGKEVQNVTDDERVDNVSSQGYAIDRKSTRLNSSHRL